MCKSVICTATAGGTSSCGKNALTRCIGRKPHCKVVLISSRVLFVGWKMKWKLIQTSGCKCLPIIIFYPLLLSVNLCCKYRKYFEKQATICKRKCSKCVKKIVYLSYCSRSGIKVVCLNRWFSVLHEVVWASLSIFWVGWIVASLVDCRGGCIVSFVVSQSYEECPHKLRLHIPKSSTLMLWAAKVWSQ